MLNQKKSQSKKIPLAVSKKSASIQENIRTVKVTLLLQKNGKLIQNINERRYQKTRIRGIYIVITGISDL